MTALDGLGHRASALPFKASTVPELQRSISRRPSPSLGMIGVGAFGEFCLPYLRPFFDIRIFDLRRDVRELAARYDVQTGDLATIASQDVILLAAPIGAIPAVARAIAPHLRPDSLVVDVCSLKMAPLAVLEEVLPPSVAIVGIHPLFGPQTGRDGIAGKRVAVCAARGKQAHLVAHFLRRGLGLDVIETTPEQHDREMAHVQGLTHLIARIIVMMELPALRQTTATFDHLMMTVESVRHDSEELFRAITHDNPFVEEVIDKFFKAASEVHSSLALPPRVAAALADPVASFDVG